MFFVVSCFLYLFPLFLSFFSFPYSSLSLFLSFFSFPYSSLFSLFSFFSSTQYLYCACRCVLAHGCECAYVYYKE